MKVKDLIRRLERADQELNVFVSPLVLVPSMLLDSETGELSDEVMMKTANPDEKYPLAKVTLCQITNGPDTGNKYIILTYDEATPASREKGEEFIN